MVKTVMYTAAIATISILLIGMMAFDAEAKSFSHDHAVILIGDSFNVRGPPADVFITPINDDILNVNLFYSARIDGEKIKSGSNCIAPKQILKISAMKKATVEFDTSDIDCPHHSGDHGVISLSFQYNGETNFQVYDDTNCEDIGEGVEECTRTHGNSDEAFGVVSGTVFGESLLPDKSGTIKTINEKRVMWTQP